MDFVEPLHALVPGATGKVLSVVLQASGPLSGRAISRLAGVSPAQGNRVLGSLVELGLVEGHRVPPAYMYRLVEGHVATEPLRALAASLPRVVETLRLRIADLDPMPVAVTAFGSFARSEAGRASDIDLVVVRPRHLAWDDEAWARTVVAIYVQAGEITGNDVDIIEAGEGEVADLLASDRPLWQSIGRDGLPIHGPPLAEV